MNPSGEDVRPEHGELVRSQKALPHPSDNRGHSSVSHPLPQPAPLPDGACVEEEVTPKFPVLLARYKPDPEIFYTEIIATLGTTLVRRTTFVNGAPATLSGIARLVIEEDKRKPRSFEVPYETLREAVAAMCAAMPQIRPQRKANTRTSLSFPLAKKLTLCLRSPGEAFFSRPPDLDVLFLVNDSEYHVTTPHNLFRTYLAIFHSPQHPLVPNPNAFLSLVNRLT